MSEEREALLEASNLLSAVADSLNPAHPYYKERIDIEKIPHKEVALMLLCARPDFSRLDLAKLSFGLGVYLCQQYYQLNKIIGR